MKTIQARTAMMTITGIFCLSASAIFAWPQAAPNSSQAPAASEHDHATAHDTPQGAGQGQRLAEEQFKNIQVLKGIPAEQLIPTMQFIAASLGVECDYCHNPKAMDNDDKKPKVIARKMITMMLAIDKDNFDGRRQVTCNSCHRGAAHPVGIPEIKPPGKIELRVGGMEGRKESAPDARKTGGPEGAKVASPDAMKDGAPGALGEDEARSAFPPAEQLLDKYLEAVGGAAATAKITSRVQTGQATAFGKQFAAEIYTKAPGKRVSLMHMPGGDSVTGVNEQQGWMSMPNRVHTMSAAEADAARVDADLQFAAHVKNRYAKFRVEPGEKIDGQETWLVIGRAEGQPPLRLYFDQKSGLLLRLVRYSDTALGLNPTQIDYADYREADGVKVPFRWTLARPGNQFTIQVEKMQQNVAVDDAKFVAPPSPPPPGH